MLVGVVCGAAAMTLLWLVSFLVSTLPALLAAGAVAALGGYASAPRMGRGAAGANLAGLCSLAGVALVAVPLLVSGAGSGITGTQVILFGLALAAISAMAGQLTGTR